MDFERDERGEQGEQDAVNQLFNRTNRARGVALMNPLPIADEPLSPDEASQPGFLTHCERIMAKVARKIIGLISPIYPLQNQIATVTWST